MTLTLPSGAFQLRGRSQTNRQFNRRVRQAILNDFADSAFSAVKVAPVLIYIPSQPGYYYNSRIP